MCGEYGKGDVILKPRSDKKENCTAHLRRSRDPTQQQQQQPNKTETYYAFFSGGADQDHDMEKRVVMENSRTAASAAGAKSSPSALKQMEQMMGRNYSDFMRSLAAKYNQNSAAKE